MQTFLRTCRGCPSLPKKQILNESITRIRLLRVGEMPMPNRFLKNRGLYVAVAARTGSAGVPSSPCGAAATVRFFINVFQGFGARLARVDMISKLLSRWPLFQQIRTGSDGTGSEAVSERTNSRAS